MEIQRVYVKTRAEFGKQCIFDDCGTNVDEEIKPKPDLMNDYILKTHCHVSVQQGTQFAVHEAQTLGASTKSSGMFHIEGGWPKEINPRDEEVTARFRRRVEKDDNWAPKLRNLFNIMEHSVLQNSAVNIYQHYFNDMIPTQMVEPLDLRTVNVFSDPENPRRPVSNISWSPDSGRKIVVSYCFLDFGRPPDYSNNIYIWQIDNSNKPYMVLQPFCPSVVTEFNPRDPSVLVSGLMSGQVCSWDIRVGTKPIHLSHRQFSHRGHTNAVKWIPTKSNCEFFSMSTDGRAMWWDTRNLHQPTESLMFDLEQPNDPDIDRAVGVSCLNFGPMVGTKFMFGLENGMVLTGSRKAKTNAEKLALRFEAHYGPVLSVDRNVFNPAVFMTVGDWTTRIWVEDTKEGNLAVAKFLPETPTGGCWNKSKLSVFYVITATGLLTAWDLLQGLHTPVLTIQLCEDSLTTIAPCEEGTLLAIGNSVGKVYLVETTESLHPFDRKERTALSEYFERHSRFTKAVDTRLKEIRLTHPVSKHDLRESLGKVSKHGRHESSKKSTADGKEKQRKSSGSSRGKGTKSIGKEKRRQRDEFPDIVEAEEKFFQIVEEERTRILEESSLATEKSSISTSSKRHMSRKVDKRRTIVEKEEQQTAQPQTPHKQPGQKKKKLKKQASEAFIETRKQRVSGSRSEDPLLSDSVGDAGLDDWMLKQQKRSSPRRAKVCRSRVCKPRICCRKVGTGSRTRLQRKETRVKDESRMRKETSKQAHFEGKEGKIEEGKSVRQGVAGEESPLVQSKVMDDRRAADTGLRISDRKRIRILRKMLAPPTFLTAEVERAKGEIQELRRLTRKVQRGYTVERITSTRVQKRRDRGRGRGSKKQEDLQVRREDSREDQGKKIEGRRAMSKEGNPHEASTSKKLFETFLGGPLPKSKEDKPVRGKDYLDKAEAARDKVYPRISEFHLNE